MTARHALPAVPPYPIATDHATIEVRADPHRPAGRLLLIDGVESSYVDLSDPRHLQFEYLRHLARLVDLARPRRLSMAMVQIGGGPCALPRYLEATRRDLRAVVLERDGGLVAAAREWLGLVTSPRLEVRVREGRAGLAELPDAAADLLVVDAFAGVLVPHHLLTAEFLEEAGRVLRPGGLHAINLIDVPPLGLASAAVATLAERFASVLLLADEAVLERGASGNLVIAASDAPLPTETLARLVALDPVPWRLLTGRALRRFAEGAPALRDGVRPDHELARLGGIWGRTSARGLAGKMG